MSAPPCKHGGDANPCPNQGRAVNDWCAPCLLAEVERLRAISQVDSDDRAAALERVLIQRDNLRVGTRAVAALAQQVSDAEAQAERLRAALAEARERLRTIEPRRQDADSVRRIDALLDGEARIKG